MLLAYGFIAADVQNEFAQTYLRTTDDTPVADLRAAVDALIAEARDWLTSEDVDSPDHKFELYADCRYYRQDIQIPCALGPESLDDGGPLAADVRRGAPRYRELDAHAALHHRRRHHEDNQQHEHHIDQRHDVDFGQRARGPAAAP